VVHLFEQEASELSERVRILCSLEQIEYVRRTSRDRVRIAEDVVKGLRFQCIA
jgi:hypothetical protein